MKYLEITDDSHKKNIKILNNHAKLGKSSVLFLTAPWCGYCNSLKPELLKMKCKLKEGDVIVSNVSDKYHSQLEMDTDVHGFPTIRKYNGTKKLKDYEGRRIAVDLAKFANELISDIKVGGRRKTSKKRRSKKREYSKKIKRA